MTISALYRLWAYSDVIDFETSNYESSLLGAILNFKLFVVIFWLQLSLLSSRLKRFVLRLLSGDLVGGGAKPEEAGRRGLKLPSHCRAAIVVVAIGA